MNCPRLRSKAVGWRDWAQPSRACPTYSTLILAVPSPLNPSTSAVIAWSHGFGHIQVHAAHGYLLSLLVDHRISPDADWALSRLSALAHRCRGEGIETSIRISLRTGDRNFDAAGREDFRAAIAMLAFDFVDVSSGFYNIDKQLIYPARPDMLTNRRTETVQLAEAFPRRRFILSGRAST